LKLRSGQYTPQSISGAPILLHEGNMFRFLDKAHKECGHLKLGGTQAYLRDTLLVGNMSPEIVKAYLSCCATCEATQLRRTARHRRASVPRVIISTHFGQRGQVI
jgi:hypothetical protein